MAEFESAIRLSHGHCRDDTTTLTRHKHFFSAIKNQVNRVQSALCENGEQPLCWVDLNKEECDDLAMFLSVSSQTSESFSSESINLSRCHEKGKKRFVSDIEATPKEKGYKPLFWIQRCRDYTLYSFEFINLENLNSGFRKSQEQIFRKSKL
ncbi:unnamed protein product [Eruca vesicaria subsp. sativa]|uniref:Uncharacterized protein n=1 Tax=Eruca vesicaria subsp. sativa TaxID=29727 RepID=A0ABC8M464_ERUVS|nr:unnamed protein product [Eruca vesicaria subsp. sativa]